MSMTREEARIEIQSLKDTFEELEPGGTRTQVALEIALTALRPIRREQVEKMKAKVVEAEAEVPMALAEALRSGNLGVMDYFGMKQVQADTAMRERLGSTDFTKIFDKKEEK